MRLIPGKTKVGVELLKGFSLTDLIIYFVGGVLSVLFFVSSLPGRIYIGGVIAVITVMLGVHLDKDPMYRYLYHILRFYICSHKFKRTDTDEILLRKAAEPEQEPAAEKTADKTGKTTGKKGKSEKAPKETAEQKAARLKEESEKKAARAKEEADKKKAAKEKEAARKAEDKLLKSKKTPPEEKEKILEARRVASKEAALKMAIYKDEHMTRAAMSRITAFTDIHDDLIDYDGKYYGAAIEIPPVEFRFFSQYRRKNAIENGVGRILRAVRGNLGMNIVKIDRPINYEEYLDHEYDKMDELRQAYENGFFTEEELKARIDVLYDRINDLRDLCYGDKVVAPFYYIVLFDSDKQQLASQVRAAMDNLTSGEMRPKRLNTKELAVFLKYTNQIDFDEHDIDKLKPEQYTQWAMPEIVDMTPRTVVVNHILTHNFCVTSYPSLVGDAWLAGVMSMPSTKVVVKCAPMDRTKSLRAIDRSLQELREQYRATGIDSKRMELQSHIDTLSSLLNMLQGENEALVECNIYVTAYDIGRTRETPSMVQPPKSARSVFSEMKKTVKRIYQEKNFRLNHLEFDQIQAYVASQVSGYDPLHGQGRGIPTNSVAACFPWIYATVSDKNGIKLGASQGVPVFIDFFRRDSERVNSNMVIVGKSGSGKSYATKSLLTNLAADNSKIYILDPENEYTELAQNLHGKFINVANAQFGRLNPFHIITALDDDEGEGDEGEEKKSSGSSYATHLQFLEEFFRQILPECDKDAMEYLNSMIDRVYTNKGITEETDLSKLKPSDYPIFDDLYDTILEEFQSTDNEYIRNMLRSLMNYVSKFSTGGRNATIWNGPSSITTEENFTVFNFQSLLANRNGTVANAQMLLVLKYIDNEIIKNREYNNKYHAKRKIVVVIDEAHVFIDSKFPVALDFMFQLAKRIRKYNGMQIVITQNIKDFVGSEELARKSTAIINACQYSFIFSLAPNDMDDLCKLYEKAGGINESEQEQIVQAGRGQAFTVMSPTSRSSFKVEVPDGVRDLFENRDHKSTYFAGKEGAENWEDFMEDSREKRAANAPKQSEVPEEEPKEEQLSSVIFEEVSEEEYRKELKEQEEEEWGREERESWEEQKRGMREQRRKQEERSKRTFTDEEVDDLLLDIPDDPEEFMRMRQQQAAAAQPAYPASPVAPGYAATAAPYVAPTIVAPAAPSVVQPIVVQAPAAAAPATSPDMEKMVSQLTLAVENLTRLSYESIVGSIRSSMGTPAAAEETPGSEYHGAGTGTVERTGIPAEPVASGGTALGSIFNEDALAEAARLNREEAEAQQAESQKVSESEQPEEAEEQEEADDFDFLSSLFSTEEESDEEDSDSDEESDSGEENEGGVAEDDSDVDLMSMLFSAIDTSGESSVIDMMELYGDTVINISLQELATHIVQHANDI